MKVNTLYQCEICGTEYQTREDADSCEAWGLPDPMPFLPWDKEIPAFGESGVRWGRLTGVFVRNHAGSPHDHHEWGVYVDPYVHVSHNLDSDDAGPPARAFDPREGFDAFRYIDKDNPGEHLRVWEETMKEYGFDDKDVDEMLMAFTIKRMREGAKCPK